MSINQPCCRTLSSEKEKSATLHPNQTNSQFLMDKVMIAVSMIPLTTQSSGSKNDHERTFPEYTSTEFMELLGPSSTYSKLPS